MDWNFWIPIVLGAAIGLVVSVVANLLTPVFLRYWKTRRAAKLEDSKRKAFNTYQRLKALYENKTDRHLYFIEVQTRIICSTILSAMAMVIALISAAPLNHLDWAAVWNKLDVYFAFGFAGISTLLLAKSAQEFSRLREWRWRLDNFATYETELREKYGNPI